MIAALLSEGTTALRDAEGTTARRMKQGLERPHFIIAFVVASVVTMMGLIVPELSGISEAMDRAMSDEPSSFMLTWPMFLSGSISIAALTALTIWRGPQLAHWLANKLGGQSDLMGAAIWIYLATAASIVISLVIMLTDIILGLAVTVLPPAIGWVSLGISLIGLLVTLSVSAQLAQNIFQFASHLRGLTFTMFWLSAALFLLMAIWVVFYAMFGGGT